MSSDTISVFSAYFFEMFSGTDKDTSDDYRRNSVKHKAAYMCKAPETAEEAQAVTKTACTQLESPGGAVAVFCDSSWYYDMLQGPSSPSGPSEFEVMLDMMNDGMFDEVLINDYRLFGNLITLFQFMKKYAYEQSMTLRFSTFSDDPLEFNSVEGQSRCRGLQMAAHMSNSLDLQQRRDEITKRITAVGDYNYTTGRPPLGFEAKNGELMQKPDRYRDVCVTIEAVDSGEISKAEAARDLGCSPKTITRILQNRREMYRLN